MDSPKTYPQKVRLELVKLLYQQVRLGLLAESLAAILLFFILQGFVNETILIAWLSFNLIVCGLGRHLLVSFFNRSQCKNKDDPKYLSTWQYLFTLGAFCSGLSWGAIGSILMVENNILRQYFEVILLVGVTSAANALYSPIRKVFLFFLMPAMIPLAYFYFSQAGIFTSLGILCCTYIIIMVATSFYAHQLVATSLRLRFQNTNLFENLKSREKLIRYQSTHDKLTNLPNRKLLLEFLNKSIEAAKGKDTKIAIFYLDMDGFKYINDSLGHTAGDKLLVQVSNRIRKCVTRNDFIAREGTDEFIIVSNLEDEKDAYTIAKNCLQCMQEPFCINGHYFNASMSIGINFYPNDDEDPDILIRNADIAMYHAKDLGKNNFQRFNQELKNKISNRSIIETKLRTAIDKNEFFLHYQPIASLKTGGITGVEALLRWDHPELGSIPPSSFISVAEESGLILSIGEWVLKNACMQGKLWLDAGISPLQLSINLSGKQFKQPHFYEQVCRVLEDTKFNPHHLSFELTESIIMEDIEKNIDVLNKMKKLGITILIDDFGVGYSSLNYLKRLPVDKLKIDRSFIQDIPNHADDIAIVSAIIALGKALDLKVIAEGVENKEHLLFLIEKECHEIQGYYLSKPVDAEACTKILMDKIRNVLD